MHSLRGAFNLNLITIVSLRLHYYKRKFFIFSCIILLNFFICDIHPTIENLLSKALVLTKAAFNLCSFLFGFNINKVYIC
jgi:hypothetical protein